MKYTVYYANPYSLAAINHPTDNNVIGWTDHGTYDTKELAERMGKSLDGSWKVKILPVEE